MIEKILQYALTLIGLAALTTLFVWGLKAGIDRSEQAECLKWKAEAVEIAPYSDENPAGYYLTKWQKQQCDHWHITIDAPTR